MHRYRTSTCLRYSEQGFPHTQTQFYKVYLHVYNFPFDLLKFITAIYIDFSGRFLLQSSYLLAVINVLLNFSIQMPGIDTHFWSFCVRSTSLVDFCYKCIFAVVLNLKQFSSGWFLWLKSRVNVFSSEIYCEKKYRQLPLFKKKGKTFALCKSQVKQTFLKKK